MRAAEHEEQPLALRLWYPDLQQLREGLRKLPETLVRLIVATMARVDPQEQKEVLNVLIPTRAILSSQLMLLRIVCLPYTEHYRQLDWSEGALMVCFAGCLALLSAYTTVGMQSSAHMAVSRFASDTQSDPVHLSETAVQREVWKVQAEFDWVVLPCDLSSVWSPARRAWVSTRCDLDPVGTMLQEHHTSAWARQMIARARELKEHELDGTETTPETRELMDSEAQLFRCLSAPLNAFLDDVHVIKELLRVHLRDRAEVIQTLHNIEHVRIEESHSPFQRSFLVDRSTQEILPPLSLSPLSATDALSSVYSPSTCPAPRHVPKAVLGKRKRPGTSLEVCPAVERSSPPPRRRLERPSVSTIVFTALPTRGGA